MGWEFECTLPIGWTLVLTGTAWPELDDFGFEVDRVSVYLGDNMEPSHTSTDEAFALALLDEDSTQDLYEHIRSDLIDAGVFEPRFYEL